MTSTCLYLHDFIHTLHHKLESIKSLELIILVIIIVILHTAFNAAGRLQEGAPKGEEAISQKVIISNCCCSSS